MQCLAKINKVEFKLFPHPPYSPNLTTSNYFLHPKLKKWLGTIRFANNKEVVSAVDGYFKELDGSDYKQCVEAIEHRQEELIELKSGYVEK